MEHFFSIDWRQLIDLFLSGITKGSIYALISLGYTMVYGVIELINFAHGEIYMLGAFTGLIVAGILGSMGYPTTAILIIGGVVAVVYCAAYGYTIEKIAYRPLRGAQRLSPLISAIGMSIFLQNYVLVAQTQDFLRYPDLIPKFSFLEAFPSLTPSAFLIIVTSAVTMLSLTLFIRFSKLGKAMRATAQNPDAAKLMGIDINRISLITCAIGAALAAAAGTLVGPIFLVSPQMGLAAISKVFAVVILGGMGNVPGAIWAAFILGLAESLTAGFISSYYKDVVTFCILIAVLIVKPAGLFGRSQIEKV